MEQKTWFITGASQVGIKQVQQGLVGTQLCDPEKRTASIIDMFLQVELRLRLLPGFGAVAYVNYKVNMLQAGSEINKVVSLSTDFAA